MWELIRSVCPDPGLKFMLPSHCQLSRPTHTWDNAVSAITGSYRSTVASNFPVAGIYNNYYSYNNVIHVAKGRFYSNGLWLKVIIILYHCACTCRFMLRVHYSSVV